MGRHRLAARRNMLGLTQEALAEQLDVAVSTVARWEQGATAPRAWQRRRLADALGVTLGELDDLLVPGSPDVSASAIEHHLGDDVDAREVGGAGTRAAGTTAHSDAAAPAMADAPPAADRRVDGVVHLPLLRHAGETVAAMVLLGALAAVALTGWNVAVVAATSAVVLVLAVLLTRSMVARRPPRLPTEQARAWPHPGDVPRAHDFVGREQEVKEIAAAVESQRVVAVVGRRGVGTSACALEAVHACRERGATRPVLYIDLRPDGRPSSLGRALADLARDLGVASPPAASATEPRHRWDTLRDALATRRALLVVDNVDDRDEVQALVPPPQQCRLLLIGTPDLAGLGGVRTVPLDEPSRDEAAELFERVSTRSDGVVAQRTDPDVRELVDLCGRQPGAVRALARGVARGPLSVCGSLETLRLVVGAPPHQRVRFFLAPAALAPEDVAYAALRPQSKRLFRRLGLVPQWRGPSSVAGTTDEAPATFVEGGLAPEPLALEAMARLVGRSTRAVAGLVDELARGQFITSVESVASAEIEEGGRYQVRPLLAAYARLHLHREEPVWRRVWTQVRLIRYLARKAERHAMRPSVAGREWFECHHGLLAAVVAMAASGAGDRAVPLPRPVRRWWFRLAEALCLWYADEGRLDEWWAVCDAVRLAPTGRRPPLLGRLYNELGTMWGRPRVRGWVHNERGVILRRRGAPRAAIAELNRALPRRGRRGEAQVLTNRGLALLDAGVVEPAIDDLKRASQRRSPRNRVGQGLTELGLGVAYLRSGAASDARRHLVKAADAFDRAKDLRGAATARANLVLAEWETGAHNAAIEVGEVAIEKYAALARSTGRQHAGGRAAALLNTGAASVCLDSPDPEGAYQKLDEGRRVRRQRPPTAETGRTTLYLGKAASLLPDRLAEARALWLEAEGICDRVGDAEGLAAIRQALAESQADDGVTA